MPSLIAWLDASSEEQKRMRDIIRLFADRDSRDELGLGQIRDAIGDGLFPGTSTLHTRARYLLFIPWIYQIAARNKDPLGEADRLERKLIASLRDSEDYAGLLGLQAGNSLKTLPSSVYWSMLRRFRILRDESFTQRDALGFEGRSLSFDELDRPGDGQIHVWSTTMPHPPSGFPKTVPGGFAMTSEEAGWLRERILDEAPNTLLAHLVTHRPEDDSPAPWLDASARQLTGGARELLDHAESFSTIMLGAQLLYNLMLAEQYEAAGFDALDSPTERYRERLERWATTLQGVLDIRSWDIDDLLIRVSVIRGTPVHPRTAQFVREWASLIRTADLPSLIDDGAARRFIARREKQTKGAQARLGNRRRLQTWGGMSGAGALVYRWPTVRGILLDIHSGLARQNEVDVA